MTNHLQLVSSEPPDQVYERLRPHLTQGLLPADPALLAIIVPGLPEPGALRVALDRLVASGRLRRVLIGAEAHLLDGAGPMPAPVQHAPVPMPSQMHVPQMIPHTAPVQVQGHSMVAPPATMVAPVAPSLDPQPKPSETVAGGDMDFELEVAIDVETERAVLWRVALVVAALGLLALLRQWMLIGIGSG